MAASPCRSIVIFTSYHLTCTSLNKMHSLGIERHAGGWGCHLLIIKYINLNANFIKYKYGIAEKRGQCLADNISLWQVNYTLKAYGIEQHDDKRYPQILYSAFHCGQSHKCSAINLTNVYNGFPYPSYCYLTFIVQAFYIPVQSFIARVLFIWNAHFWVWNYPLYFTYF